MVQGKATLILDLGNSETRGRVQYGKTAQGKIRERSFNLSNRFQLVDENYTPTGDYTPDTSFVFNVDAVVNGKRQIGRWVNGELQEKEFFTGVLKPSALDKKYQSLTTALTYNLAVYKGLCEIAKMENISDISQLDITWTVVPLLPAGDLNSGSSVLEDLIRSVKELDFSFPTVKMPIKVSEVHVLPEGYSAFTAVIFDKGRVIRKAYENIIANKEFTLVIDIGAGTSDLTVIEGVKSMNSTMTTIEVGGNNVSAIVKSRLMEIYNIKPTDANMIDAMTSCSVRDGARIIDISDIVEKAKGEVARSIVNGIIEFFEATQFPIKNISRILVCGGGSLSGESGKTKAMSDFVIEAFKTRSPYVEMLEIPEVVQKIEGDDGISSKVKERLNPRELNIIGASILSERWI